ncbi:hypothetical protein TRIATDRAFT_301031 [Trichoderma atroviride IMI 206040]|uniref:Uncharacterized protein n=1 Tax=Hypocrea atroviridis (strain ATCC 20476 / IMI 206040) TaxID=452589 RepID=G9P3X9_HYPAI|nr:uncharacterized protein TRIATDRAFT_301031 [Trichoderma atroviride IMI 206040]EHK43084.1 hypothetical protein TRIATDRAFT_301031 [Trichoderma atroviride IMI 206040]
MMESCVIGNSTLLHVLLPVLPHFIRRLFFFSFWISNTLQERPTPEQYMYFSSFRKWYEDGKY